MDEELYEAMYEEYFEEYSTHHDFNLLDLLDDEDDFDLVDRSSYDLNNDPKCIRAIEKIQNKNKPN